VVVDAALAAIAVAVAATAVIAAAVAVATVAVVAAATPDVDLSRAGNLYAFPCSVRSPDDYSSRRSNAAFLFRHA